MLVLFYCRREEEECVLRHRLCGEVGEGGGGKRNSGEST